MFSTRKSTSERDRNAGKWTTLGDQDDAFTTNVSMVDFTDMNEPSAYEYPRRWNPVYAASGESLSMGHDDDKKEGWEDRKSNTLNA